FLVKGDRQPAAAHETGTARPLFARFFVLPDDLAGRGIVGVDLHLVANIGLGPSRNRWVATLPVEHDNLVAHVADRHQRAVEPLPLQVAIVLQRAIEVGRLLAEVVLPDDLPGLSLEAEAIAEGADLVHVLVCDGRRGPHAQLTPADVPDRRYFVGVAPL